MIEAKRLVPERLRPAARWAVTRGRSAARPRLWLAPLWRSWVKTGIVRRYQGFGRDPLASVRYILFSRELANFTYDISNRDELAQTVAAAIGHDASELRAYIRELDDDDDLRRRLERRAAGAGRPGVEYGRRLGWYAAIRALKPTLVVETGVDAGLGSAVILRALERNADEGSDGKLLSVDIRSGTGALVDEDLARRWALEVDDSVAFLRRLAPTPVDMFVHDSAHTYEHETTELEVVWQIAGAEAVFVSDNAHGSTALADFCARHGLEFFRFDETPRNHFYPGAALGIARRTPEDRT